MTNAVTLQGLEKPNGFSDLPPLASITRKAHPEWRTRKTPAAGVLKA